ncbi:MAG: geranylgeranyl reductase family protein [Anaerolineales bacterium]
MTASGTADSADVVVIGAGPGGSATAHFLAKAGVNALLLDRAEFPRDKTCGDGLTPRALAVLDDLGVLDALNKIGFRIDGLEFHAPRGQVITSPIPETDNMPNYQMIVPRKVLDHVILERTVASGARFRGGVHVTGVEPSGRGVYVKGKHQGRSISFHGRVAVVATGANSRLLMRSGILDKMPPTALAARAYFEGVRGLSTRAQAHFGGIPLPGYGWVFPLSDHTANVGVGYWPFGFIRRKKHLPTRRLFENFVKTPKIRPMLEGARQVGPVKGYPIRVDFPTAITFGERTILVGEAAGLVNPLSGEGIDFALENGKIAARFLVEKFELGDFSAQTLAAYDRVLRARFQSLFVALSLIQKLYANPALLNRVVNVTAHNPELKTLFVKIILGTQNAADSGVILKILRYVVFGR